MLVSGCKALPYDLVDEPGEKTGNHIEREAQSLQARSDIVLKTTG